MNYIEKIRRAIECPQFGNENYGEWGTLNLEQRKYIRKLLYDLDIADNCSKDLYFENKQLKDNWNKLKEDLINDINDRNGTKIAEFEDGNRVSETISPIYTLMEDRSKTIKEVLDKMQEIEKERNSNVKD